MDIMQLLEVLKPAKEVVTVQIVSEKNQLGSVIDLLKAVLPAVGTAGVAWVAMDRSHRQFEQNSARQANEFRMSIEQQTKTLKIQTQLATEVDLKKEICRGVREACTQFLTHALDASKLYRKYKITLEGFDKGLFNISEEGINAFGQFMNASQSMSSSKLMLMSFLDPKEEKNFYDAIARIDQLLQEEGDGSEFGIALGVCLAECRVYINKRHQEIIELTEVISGRDSD